MKKQLEESQQIDRDDGVHTSQWRIADWSWLNKLWVHFFFGVNHMHYHGRR